MKVEQQQGHPMLKIYTLGNCDTCRKAVKWLRSHKVDFGERAIRETPPSVSELRQGLAAVGGQVRKLCNVAGGDYRAMKLGDKLPEMSDTEVLALLAGNGNLVKRPFAIGRGVVLVGFDEDAWTATLLQQ